MTLFTNDVVKLLEAAADARKREAERDARLERVEALLRTVASRREIGVDPRRLAEHIVNRTINEYNRRGFKDPLNFLSTIGRDFVREQIEEFLTNPW